MKAPTILLILQEAGALDLYAGYFRSVGYNTVVCGSPGEGLNSIETSGASVVIVGQDTPAFDGRPVLEYCTRRGRRIPVVVVARVVNMHAYLESMELGAVDYLERPDPQALARVVEPHLLRSVTA